MLALLDSPDRYLLRYHRHHTGITAWALSRGHTDSGRSSYDMLAELVPLDVGHTVLDLGCGDGLLIERLVERGVASGRIVGIDMSPDELRLARKRSEIDGVNLLCEKAEQMSIASESVGHVLSHLAFHLMSNIEAVVSELTRILIPGGLFSAILPGEPKSGDAFAIFVALFDEMYQSQATRAPKLGDQRAWTAEGLSELFNADTQFGSLATVEFDLRLDGAAMDVWNSLSARYEAYVILPRDRATLRDRFTAEVKDLERPDGTIPCAMALRQVTCRKLAPLPD